MNNEIWKDVVGYEGFYQVSNLGNVRSTHRVVRGKGGSPKLLNSVVLKQEEMHDGYLRVGLSKNGTCKRFPVHRLVAEAFISNPNKHPVVNHKDEIKSNNHASNLEWCTQSYNVMYGDGIKKVLSNENYWLTRNNKKIKATHAKTGEVLKFFSMREADREGFSRRSVGRAIQRYPYIYKGYIWEYLN